MAWSIGVGGHGGNAILCVRPVRRNAQAGIGGALPSVAFSQRQSQANMIATVDWPHGSDPDEHIAWCRRYWSRLEPYTDGFYINDGAPHETRERIRESYHQNLERLVTVKNRYDPTNVFRLNANVAPTV